MKTAILIILFIATSKASADFVDATEAYHSKDFDSAFKQFHALAKLGNKRAQFNLAVMYLNGEGTEQDLAKAYAWGQLSEHDERPDFSVVTKRLLKEVSPEDHPKLEAMALKVAAEYDESAIHTKLSPIAYIPVKNKSKNNRSHVKPIKRPAPRYPEKAFNQGKQGWVTAMFDIHPDGSVRAVNIIESFPDNSFDKASIDALHKFKFQVTFEEGVAPYVRQARQTFQYHIGRENHQKSLRQSYKKRLDELKVHASNGHPEAQYIYAVAASSNLLKQEDRIDDAAVNDWLLQSAQNGFIDAQYLLGKNILRGKGCQVEKQKGVNWIVNAAQNGHDKASREVYRLLTDYQNLNNTGQAPEVWLAQSAASGNSESQLDYALHLIENNRDATAIKTAEIHLKQYSKNRKKSVQWYQANAKLESLKGNEKKAQKYRQKAKKLAEKLGWDLSIAME